MNELPTEEGFGAKYPGPSTAHELTDLRAEVVKLKAELEKLGTEKTYLMTEAHNKREENHAFRLLFKAVFQYER